MQARAIAAAALGAALLAPAAAPALASADVILPSNLPFACRDAHRVMDRVHVDVSRLASDGIVRLDDWQLRPTAIGWRAANNRYPVREAVFHSDAWLLPVATADDTGLQLAIDLMVQQSTVNPDPGGTSSFEVLDSTGWQENNVTKRMVTASCLYSLASKAGRAQLTPVIEQLANANMDPNRYYGPPVHPVHNHGVFADLELRRAGLLLHRPDWVDTAERRLAIQLKGTFDRCGMTFEQSSTYQKLHATLWLDTAAKLPLNLVEVAQRASAKAYAALDLLARPDGIVEAIGDGSQIDVSDRLHKTDGKGQPITHTGRLWCAKSGWYANTTNVGDVTQHVTARFGPRMQFHGHADHGALTWWTGTGWNGVPVLVDRGLYSKTRDERRAYAASPAAHSTLRWDKGSSLLMTGRLISDDPVLTMAADGWAWSRKVHMGTTSRTLSVVDSVHVPAQRSVLAQNFTLDPVWRKTAVPGVFDTVDGWQLSITCTVDRAPASPRSTVAEHYPREGVLEQALTVTCAAPTRLRGTHVLAAKLTVTK